MSDQLQEIIDNNSIVEDVKHCKRFEDLITLSKRYCEESIDILKTFPNLSEQYLYKTKLIFDHQDINPIQKIAWSVAILEGAQNNNLPKILEAIFDASSLTKEQLSQCINIHLSTYGVEAANIFNYLVEPDNPNYAVIYSGMFAGKSTLAELIIKKFLEENSKTSVSRVIAGVLGQDFTHSRALNKRENAIPLFPLELLQLGEHLNNGEDFLHIAQVQDHIDKVVDQIRKEKNITGDPHVVYIDEVSFIPEEVVEELQTQLAGDNVYFLHVGLAHDYLNKPISTMQKLQEKAKQEGAYTQECRSVLPSDLKQGLPSGTLTKRQMIILDNQGDVVPVADIFGLPLAVDKSVPIVSYFPSNEKDHLVSLSPAVQAIIDAAQNLPQEIQEEIENMKIRLLQNLQASMTEEP